MTRKRHDPMMLIRNYSIQPYGDGLGEAPASAARA